MSALIAPEIKKQYVDGNGDPLSGGKLYVYEAGTVTPTDSYTTEEADVANANPIILNSRGEVGSIFLNTGSYKFVLTDASDNTLWTQDSITIRDIGSELDALSVSIQEINTTISEEVLFNRVVSGKSSDNSSMAAYLIPIGSSNQVKLLAADTNLLYVIDNQQYTLSADFVASGFVSAPTSNNTALVNDSNLSNDPGTETLGEFGSYIPYDTAGSEITALDGKLAAFKIVGTGTEYFIARVDSTNSRLWGASRGIFVDSSNNRIDRVQFSDNDTITLQKLTYLYLQQDQSLLASYTEPIYSPTEPATPVDGDMWFDTSESVWKRFSSTVFVEVDVVFVGMCIQDENGNTVAARAQTFYVETKDLNTFSLRYKDAASIQSESINNIVNVFGNKITYPHAFVEWSIVDHLEDGYTEAASTYYYAYITELGDRVVSPVAPIENNGGLNGWYHPHETWLYVGGKFFNNASSNIEEVSVKTYGDNIEFQEVSVAPLAPVAGMRKVYIKDGNLLMMDSEENVTKLGPMSTENAAYRVHAGFGSTNNKIPYFSTEIQNDTGNIVTIENSSTFGFSITAEVDCYIIIAYGRYTSSTGQWGLSLNSSELTTAIGSITNYNDRVAFARYATNEGGPVMASIKLSEGDVLRPHTAGAGEADSGNKTHLTFIVFA